MSDSKPTINTYISDMLALENHILQPTKAQLNDELVQASPVVSKLLTEIVNQVQEHIGTLENLLQQVGGHAGSSVKSSVSSMMGSFASAIDNVRKTELSKDLRDDYAALCLASVSYTMLHATAKGLDSQKCTDVAKRHLTDYATLIMRISSVMPSVVLSELQKEGVPVSTAVSAQAEKEQEQAWKEGAARSAVAAA